MRWLMKGIQISPRGAQIAPCDGGACVCGDVCGGAATSRVKIH